MCYFVAVGIPPAATAAARIAIDYRLLPAPDYVVSAFDPDTFVFVVHVGVCACDLYKEPLTPQVEARMRKRYENKGWKHTRIERVLDERRRLGGLDAGLMGHLIAGAKEAGHLSILVFWDDGVTVPTGPVIRASISQLISQPWLAAPGTRVDLSP